VRAKAGLRSPRTREICTVLHESVCQYAIKTVWSHSERCVTCADSQSECPMLAQRRLNEMIHLGPCESRDADPHILRSGVEGCGRENCCKCCNQVWTEHGRKGGGRMEERRREKRKGEAEGTQSTLSWRLQGEICCLSM
jgi:hypothetical protein